MTVPHVPNGLVVVHDFGDPLGRRRWADLLEGWPGPSLAFDLPGHGSAPPPEGGSYAPGDAALVADAAIRSAGLTDPLPVVLGHGWSAFAAELLAAASRASALVVVDGLGGPWVDWDGLVGARRRWLRGLLDDPDALAFPESSPDPRLAHGFPTLYERSFVDGLRASITVPVLALESPSSPTPAGERVDRVAAYGGSATLVEVPDTAARTVLAAVADAFGPS